MKNESYIYKQGDKVYVEGIPGIAEILEMSEDQSKFIIVAEDELGALVLSRNADEIKPVRPRKKRLSDLEKADKAARIEEYYRSQVDVLTNLYCDYLNHIPVPEDI